MARFGVGCSWPRRLVAVVLGLLAVWAVGYELACTLTPSWVRALPFSGIAPDIPFLIAGLLLIVRGIRGQRAWMLLGLGAVCWAAGDVYWSLGLSSSNSPPVPSWADAGYLMYCPLSFAGLLLLIRRRVSRVRTTVVADSVAAALAVGGLSASLVVQPVLAHAHGGTLAVATNLAYPVVDMLLLGLIVSAVGLSDWKLDRTWVLLGAAVVAFWVADSLYLITDANGTYQAGAWFNPLWYVSPIVSACAAWLPQPTARARMTRPEARGIVIPLMFAGSALGTLVWSSFSTRGVIAIGMCTLSLLVIMARLFLTWRENIALLLASQHEASTDALTGLANRRALSSELAARLALRDETRPCVLALFDLDGFKHYNDCFGHPAGDALLQRLGGNLAVHLGSRGTAYRMGGDEFCVLLDIDGSADVDVASAAGALSEHGEGFAIGCSYGFVTLPAEAHEIEDALRIADQRMYAQKHGGRVPASRQSSDVLLRALAERDPELGSHVRDVADLAATTAVRLGLDAEEVERVRQAAELHDIGKVAIPDAILGKPGPLSDAEWEFMRRHTVIGERILLAAPALSGAAALVRSSHENFDGTGYPDRLAGQAIPIGARIILVCDAFHAMTTDRPYREALDQQTAVTELRRCAGTQFDPDVVEHFCAVVAERESVLAA